MRVGANDYVKELMAENLPFFWQKKHLKIQESEILNSTNPMKVC
jgi:hypothetical protein